MDTVELKLPSSGKTVVLRNYTTRKDDIKAEEYLYAGVNAEQKDTVSGAENKVNFPIANVMASQACYIPRLVQSIDGDSTGMQEKIEDLRSQDYKALEEKVDEIVEANSPKAVGALKASTDNTPKK